MVIEKKSLIGSPKMSMDNETTDAGIANARISDHIAECSRWRRDCADQIRETNAKIDQVNKALGDILKQLSETSGRMAANKVLLGGIPNAFWSVVIAAAGSGLTIFALRVLAPLHGGG